MNQALELFQTLGTRWQIGRTFFERGELEVSRRNFASARDSFSRALIEFEAMRAEPDATNTRARLRNLDGEAISTLGKLK